MRRKKERQLDDLTRPERIGIEALAEKAGMTVEEWVEYSQKAQIYQNAEEVLTGKEAI